MSQSRGRFVEPHQTGEVSLISQFRAEHESFFRNITPRSYQTFLTSNYYFLLLTFVCHDKKRFWPH